VLVLHVSNGWVDLPLEAIVERAWIVPVMHSIIVVVRPTATVDNDAQEDEANYSHDLDYGEYKLGFSISFNTKEIDDNDDKQKYRYPSGGVCVSRSLPELKGN